MKRRAVLPLLFILLPSAGAAQVIRGWGVEGGLSGGFQLITITQGDRSPAVPRVLRTGLTAGVFVELLNMPHLSLLLQGSYTQKGRTITDAEVAASPSLPGLLSPGPSGGTPRLDYLSLAVLVKLRAWREGFVPYTAIGPRFDILTGKSDAAVPVFSHVRMTDVGVTVAGGVEIVPRRTPVVSLECRWSPVFTRIVSVPTLTIKNQSVELLLALWL